MWGLGGFGRGGLTVTPDERNLYGNRHEPPDDRCRCSESAPDRAAHGMNVAFETDGFWVHAASDGTPPVCWLRRRTPIGCDLGWRVRTGWS